MRWRRYILILLAATAALCLALMVFILVSDPYDTGWFAGMGKSGIPAYGQRMANASRARDPQYDSAIVGNSTVQLLSPARLDAKLGGSFVSLPIPGTGPYEQLTVLDWFITHHPNGIRFVVIGIDSRWCDGATEFSPRGVTYPFPFWLYANSRWDYLGHVFSYKSIEAGTRRLAALSKPDKLARADGFNDYELGKHYDRNAAQRLMELGANDDDATADTGSAAAVRAASATPVALPFVHLGAILRSLPATATVVLVFPPREAGALPAPGSAGAAAIAACKSAAQELADGDTRVKIVDFLGDTAIARDPDNFWDNIHYRGIVARQIEDQVVAAAGR
jgi:hypothetical protein